MTMCVLPPELDAMQLAAFVTGEADRVTIDHLAVCLHCRVKAASAARVHQSLAHPLFRVHCPTPDDLREYHFGFLPDAQMEEITQHLQSCARCTREIVSLDEFMAETDAPALPFEPWGDLRQRVKTIVARLLPRPMPGASLTPAMGGLRGTPDAMHSLYQAGELQIVIQSERDPRQPEARVLLGAVWGSENDWTAHLWQDQRHIASTLVDDLGSFRFANVAPAPYEIILAGLHLKIEIAPVMIR